MSEQEVFDALKYRIEVDKRGTRRYFNGANQLHRLNGPAIECSDGHKEWIQNGLRHRTDGPAIELADGTKHWCRNGLLHRTDGAAIEFADGTKHWCRNGLLHRTDGPAIEWYDGEIEWWINGEELTEADFNQLVVKMSEIAVFDTL